ncbi:MAG: hypothetical protein LC799_09850, partial [Actinobacteria bacterium]|nr:hypothetical protein [Actinomycetota bacterium]
MPLPWEPVGEAVGDAAGAVAGGVVRGVEAVGGVLDIGEPSGADGGSSNWSAWGHAEIRSMLDTTVEPGLIHEIARLWRTRGEAANAMMTTLTAELRAIVSAGWRGESADAAVRSLEPVQAWAATVREAAERTTQLMDASGSSVGQAKTAVPPPVPHDWRQSLTSYARGGLVGVG